jgi:hypothetical protein
MDGSSSGSESRYTWQWRKVHADRGVRDLKDGTVVRSARRAHVGIIRRVPFQRLHNSRVLPGGQVVSGGLLDESELLVAHVVCGHGDRLAWVG